MGLLLWAKRCAGGEARRAAAVRLIDKFRTHQGSRRCPGLLPLCYSPWYQGPLHQGCRVMHEQPSDSPRPIADRGPALPAEAACYRRIGPFTPATLPSGLRSEHRLKQGVWGLVRLLEGSVTFVWDDAAAGSRDLSAPAEILVPPTVPHHLVGDGPFVIEIDFLAVPKPA